MNFREILEYKIIDTGNFGLSLYSILLSALMVLITLVVLKVIRRVVRRRSMRGKLDPSAYWTIFQVLRYLIWVIVTVQVLDNFGIKVTVLLTSIAALLIGVGLGIQQIFGDLVSGFVILLERNLKMDDVIQLEDGTVGRVVEIGFRTSRIRTRDDIVMVIPNSKFVNDRIINWNNIDNRTRHHVNVGVAYGSDVALVQDILLKVAGSNERVAKQPLPFVRFLDFGESSLNFQLFFWVEESFYVENIKSELRFAIDAGFREGHVQIPFPQRDVHLITPKS